MEPDNLENQLTAIMKTVLEVYKELNGNETGESKTQPISENLMKKSKEIVFLSKNLNNSIEECEYLSKDQAKLDQQITECFEEKSKKLEEFAKLMSGAEQIQESFHEALRNLNEMKVKSLNFS